MINLRSTLSSSIQRYAAFAAIALTLLVGTSLVWNTNNLYKQAAYLATVEARANWNKDQALRRWATLHGGLYVKPDERTPPNPYLGHLPNRDVETTDGVKLTLMNPAYMMSQMTKEFEALYGIKGKITGQILLNPANEPDPWELSALKQFDNGAKEVLAQENIDGMPYIRFMRPMIMTEGCVLCHGHLGFKVGDIRGGVSISVPLMPYIEATRKNKTSQFFTHGVVWSLGIFALGFLSLRGQQREREKKEAEEQLGDAIESISDGFVLFDEDDRLVICNSRYKELYGYSDEDVRPGVYTRQLGQLDINRGTVILDESVDQYLNRRDDHQDLNQKPYIIHLNDGRILETRDRKTLSGGIVSTQEDVTEFRLAQEELEKSHTYLEARIKERTQQLQKLSLAVEQSPNAVFITDLHGTIEYINPKFTDLTGYTPEESIGQNPRILKSNETPRELYSDLWKTIRKGNNWKGEIKDRRKDGSHFWAFETIAPVKDENGFVTHYVATHEDISERKEAELMTRSALEQAEVANRAKSDLMANMSHELRTPLNAIIGFSETMKEETFGPVGSDKNREYLEDIHHSGQHLLELINDILDVSAIEAGALELHEEKVSLIDVVEVSVRFIRPRAEAGRVSVTSTIDPEIPMIYADERRVKQVFLNLLSNSVKFTPEGGEVTVSAWLNDNGSLAVAVADTGIGMDEEEMTKALSTFGQVDSGLDRKHEGTGLGLPLAKRLMELHGGTLEIESEKALGSSITVTFPKKRVIQNA